MGQISMRRKNGKTKLTAALDERRSVHEAAFRAHHPLIAAELRQMRRDQRKMRKTWAHGSKQTRPGTPETYERASVVRQGAIARLYQRGDIDIEQMAAAHEIAAIAEFIGRDVSIRTMSMETRVDNGGRGDAAFESLALVRREMAYSAWRAEISHPVAPVLAMIIFDVGVSVAAKRYRMRNMRAKKLLIDALDLWRTKIRDAMRYIDRDVVDRAQEGLF